MAQLAPRRAKLASSSRARVASTSKACIRPRYPSGRSFGVFFRRRARVDGNGAERGASASAAARAVHGQQRAVGWQRRSPATRAEGRARHRARRRRGWRRVRRPRRGDGARLGGRAERRELGPAVRRECVDDFVDRAAERVHQIDGDIGRRRRRGRRRLKGGAQPILLTQQPAHRLLPAVEPPPRYEEVVEQHDGERRAQTIRGGRWAARRRPRQFHRAPRRLHRSTGRRPRKRSRRPARAAEQLLEDLAGDGENGRA